MTTSFPGSSPTRPQWQERECIALVLDQNSLGNLRISFCTLALWKRVYIHIHIVKLEENENTIIFGLCCRNVP